MPSLFEVIVGLLDKLRKVGGVSSDLSLGIDIGSSSLKIIGLKGTEPGDAEVAFACFEEMPVSAVIDGQINDTRTTAETIKAALAKVGVKPKNQPVAIGLRGLNVIYKIISLPLQSDEEMVTQVMQEAGQLVDNSLEDWSMDWQRLGDPDRNGNINAVVVVARKNLVESYVETIQSTGLRLHVVDCDIFAIENAWDFAATQRDDNVLCLDVGRDSTKLVVIREGLPAVVRHFATAGVQLTENLSRIYGVGLEQAEMMKIGRGDFGEWWRRPEYSQVINPFADDLCEEVKRTIDFYASHSSSGSSDIDHIILSGASASAWELKEKIQQFFSTPVELANPFRNAKVSAEADALISQAPHVFNVAMGLALRRMGDKPL